MTENTAADTPLTMAVSIRCELTPKHLIHMGAVMPALCAAKSTEEVEEICAHNNIPYSGLNPTVFIACRLHRGEYDVHSPQIPSWSEWLFAHSKTVLGIHKFYTACFSSLEAKKDSLWENESVFSVLHYASNVRAAMLEQAQVDYGWIPNQEDRAHRLAYAAREADIFPLAAVFDGFQKADGAALEKKYGYVSKQIRRRGEESPAPAVYFYWQNPMGQKEARNRLWKYVYQKCDEEKYPDRKYILNWNPQELIARYMGYMDKYVEEQVRGSSVRIGFDSLTGESTIYTRQLDCAMYLWLLSEVQSRQKYRVCKMCGNLFRVGAHKDKKYCSLHKKYEINYFNRKIREIAEQSSASPDDSNEM